MQANRGRDTRPELALRSAVHALGLRYRVSTRPIKSLRRTADLVFPKLKVAVFLDGCFWHGCEQHHTIAVTNAEYWAEKVRHNRTRDRETDRQLSEASWTVVRIWEHEDPQTAALRIHDVVTACQAQPTQPPRKLTSERPASLGTQDPQGTGAAARH
jgi:DNA mismatch endonuclease (patch repair protein)